jgi:hypothetical protein
VEGSKCHADPDTVKPLFIDQIALILILMKLDSQNELKEGAFKGAVQIVLKVNCALCNPMEQRFMLALASTTGLKFMWFGVLQPSVANQMLCQQLCNGLVMERDAI